MLAGEDLGIGLTVMGVEVVWFDELVVIGDGRLSVEA